MQRERTAICACLHLPCPRTFLAHLLLRVEFIGLRLVQNRDAHLAVLVHCKTQGERVGKRRGSEQRTADGTARAYLLRAEFRVS